MFPTLITGRARDSITSIRLRQFPAALEDLVEHPVSMLLQDFVAGSIADVSGEFQKASRIRGASFYAGSTRRFISTAIGEWVSAPTEMKSTPVSA